MELLKINDFWDNFEIKQLDETFKPDKEFYENYILKKKTLNDYIKDNEGMNEQHIIKNWHWNNTMFVYLFNEYMKLYPKGPPK